MYRRIERVAVSEKFHVFALLPSVVKMAKDHTNDWRWLACTLGNIETFCHRIAVLLRSHDTLNHICIADGINLRDRNRAFAPCTLWGPTCPPLGPWARPPPPRALGALGPPDIKRDPQHGAWTIGGRSNGDRRGLAPCQDRAWSSLCTGGV